MNFGHFLKNEFVLKKVHAYDRIQKDKKQERDRERYT